MCTSELFDGDIPNFSDTTAELCVIRRSYKNKTGKMRPILEALRPLMPFTALFVITTIWVLRSRNDICFMEPRLMFLLFGTIFSNICVSAQLQHKVINHGVAAPK